MLTEAEKERRASMVANGLAHYGACRCGVGSRGVEAKLRRCQTCGVRSCFHCSQKLGACCLLYRDFYTDVMQLLTTGGYEFQPMGGLLSRPTIDAMIVAVEKNEDARDFAAWLLREQRAAKPVLSDERDVMGNETISPKDVAA